MYTIKKDSPIMRDKQSSDGLKEMIKEMEWTKPSTLTMIEIGSFIGESTVIFGDHFKKVIAIDPFMSDYDPLDTTSKFDFNEVYEEYKRRTEPYSNIETLRMTSEDAFEVLKGDRYDFVYIDGIHQYTNVKEDIKNYIKVINKSGYIGGHDYGGVWTGVKQAVDEIFGKPDKVFSDLSWIKKL